MSVKMIDLCVEIDSSMTIESRKTALIRAIKYEVRSNDALEDVDAVMEELMKTFVTELRDADIDSEAALHFQSTTLAKDIDGLGRVVSRNRYSPTLDIKEISHMPHEEGEDGVRFSPYIMTDGGFVMLVVPTGKHTTLSCPPYEEEDEESEE